MYNNEMLKITITYIYIVNWFSTRVPKPLNWERTGFSTNSAGRTGYHMQNKKIWMPTSLHIQKPTLHIARPKCKS